jgi:hypothetical protein
MVCQIDRGDRLFSGRIIDASYSGIGIMLPEGAESITGEVRVHIAPAHQSSVESPEEIRLRARPAYLKQMSKGHHVGFKIAQIESGEPEWKRLCDGLTRNAQTDPPLPAGLSQDTDPGVTR